MRTSPGCNRAMYAWYPNYDEYLFYRVLDALEKLYLRICAHPSAAEQLYLVPGKSISCSKKDKQTSSCLRRVFQVPYLPAMLLSKQLVSTMLMDSVSVPVYFLQTQSIFLVHFHPLSRHLQHLHS